MRALRSFTSAIHAIASDPAGNRSVGTMQIPPRSVPRRRCRSREEVRAGSHARRVVHRAIRSRFRAWNRTIFLGVDSRSEPRYLQRLVLKLAQ